MKTKLKMELEEAIDKVILKNVDGDAWPENVYIHEQLAVQMANAAEAVFDSSVSGQQFAEENK